VKQKIKRKAPVQNVVGKPATKPARQMQPAAAGIGTAPPKFVPQPRKK
jgi:hypothetical protein